MAVLVDSKHPIRCASRVTTAPIIHLRCKMLTAPEEYCTETFLGTKWSDFAHLSHNGSNSKCVLLRAVCVALGLVDTTKKM